MRAELSDKLIRETAPPERGYVIIWDTIQAGFGCRIVAPSRGHPNGARSFICNYHASGRQRSMTLGSFPPWRTGEARNEAKKLKLDVSKGADPVADKQAARTAPTVNDLADLYRQVHLPRKRESSRRGDEGMLAKDILPKLGHKKVGQIAYTDIAALHRAIAERAPIVANRCMALLSKMFSMAIKEGWRTDNPASGIERNPENKRERFLDPDELRRLFEALDARPGQSTNVIKLLLMTGARRGEVLGAKWTEFDLDSGVWVKPSAHTKQKKVHRVPLSTDAIDLLTAIRDEARGQGKIEVAVFPSKSRQQQLWQLNKFWATVCAEAGLEDIHVHDLRHSYASLLAGSGLSLPIIGALLGHTQAATTQRYSHLLDAPLRAATKSASRAISEARKAAPKVVKFKP